MVAAYATNDGYCRHLAVSLCSLLDNNTDEPEIEVYVLSDGVSGENKRKLSQVAQSRGGKIRFAEIGGIEKRFPCEVKSNGFSPIVFARLFLASLLPESVDKVLYLDCDTAVAAPVGGIFGGMGDNLAALVPELYMPPEKRERIGLGKGECYYNAGVMAANLGLWRKEKLEDKFLAYYRENKEKLLYNDQDVLNYCCRGRIKTLGLEYNISGNHFYFHWFAVRRLQPYYAISDRKDFLGCVRNPRIIHFMGDERPWIAGNRNFYRSVYGKYLALTPYRNAEKIKGKRAYMACYHALNLITWLCPPFRVLFSKYVGINKYLWAGKE